MFGVDIRNRCTVVRVDYTVFIDIDNFELSQSEVRAGVSVDDFGIIVVSSVADIAERLLKYERSAVFTVTDYLKKKATAHRLLAMGLSAEQVAAATQLSLDEIKKL